MLSKIGSKSGSGRTFRKLQTKINSRNLKQGSFDNLVCQMMKSQRRKIWGGPYLKVF